MVGYMPSVTRTPGDHGEYIAKFDEEFRQRWRELGEWKELPEAEAVVPTADEWAAQVDHVIKTVGADHVAFGLDAVGGRSAVPRDASRLRRPGRGAEQDHHARERAQDHRGKLAARAGKGKGGVRSPGATVRAAG